MKASISKSKTRNKPTNSSLQISHRVKAFQKNVKNKQHCLVGGFFGGGCEQSESINRGLCE